LYFFEIQATRPKKALPSHGFKLFMPNG